MNECSYLARREKRRAGPARHSCQRLFESMYYLYYVMYRVSGQEFKRFRPILFVDTGTLVGLHLQAGAMSALEGGQTDGSSSLHVAAADVSRGRARGTVRDLP